jgi:GT2 family glycosyltransferase
MTSNPFLSVIIPTRNRARALAQTLDGLFEQHSFEGGFEIVVSDNGSADDTRGVIDEARKAGTFPLKVIEHPLGGPAAARNAAIDAAGGELLLLLGDDTMPASPNLLASHAALHRSHPESAFACLGRIEWSPYTPVTEFMHWLDHGGPQFHYWEIEGGWVRPENYFYSSHLSLKRSAFVEVGGFDERFPYAAVEDTDLGTRLADHGINLEYHPELLVWHDHPTTLEQSLERAIRVGRCAALYNSIRLRPHPRVQGPGRISGIASSLAAPLLAFLSRAPGPVRMRERIWSLAHRYCYAIGYRLGPPETQ